MAQQTSVSSLLDMTSSSNVVFLGEAGSGKSELALNFAQALAELGGKPVHFFDLDMTSPSSAPETGARPWRRWGWRSTTRPSSWMPPP